MLTTILPLGLSLAALTATPIPDTQFLQEVGRQVPFDKPITAVCASSDGVFAGTTTGLMHLDAAGALAPVETAPTEAIRRIGIGNGAMWVACENSFNVQRDGAWKRLAEGSFIDAAEWQGTWLVTDEEGLYRWADGDVLEPLATTKPARFAFKAMDVYADTVYLCSLDRLVTYDGHEFNYDKTVDIGAMPSKDLRDIAGVGNALLVATSQGVGILRGTIVTQILGADGLPYEELTCITRGFGGDVWLGTRRGAIRMTSDGDFHYFCGPRWLPNDRVNAIALSENTVYIATDGGLGIIDYVPFTLEQKAAYYEAHLDAWAQKRGAFTHKLEWDEAADKWMREVSDNDVGWSTHYWAAMAFKYAATGDEQAKKIATDGFNLMKWSEEITGIPGFPARGVWAVGETGHQTSGGSGGFAAEWHLTPDGLWEWKGDTSSDETDAQYYYASIFHDLVADNIMKAQVREHLSRVTGHIVDNGYVLLDVDNKPTVWARWDEEYLSSAKGFYARGLNGLGILGYLRTAQAITGEQRFGDALQSRLAAGYHTWVIPQKYTAPPMMVNHSDDRLAFYIYYPLLQYETDPQLRSIYRRSFDRSWAVERVENNPWFTFIHGKLTGAPDRLHQAIEHLRAWPLDMINHPYDHTHRRDLNNKADAIDYTQEGKILSPRERGPLRWSDNPFELQGGSGKEVVDPSGWLDAYWMARYCGFIAAPAASAPPPILPEPRADVVPYDGPPFPWVLE